MIWYEGMIKLKAGDWEVIRERWPLVRQLFSTPGRMRWGGFGSHGQSSNGDEAAHCATFARLAYKVGDMDSYHYASHAFARQLAVLSLRQRGAEYFRRHQPWHSMEVMGEDVFLTSYREYGTGWLFDGPKYPAQATAREFSQRWERFNDFDVARFYREYLQQDVQQEMNWLQQRAQPAWNWRNEPQGLPSPVQLRSLLLSETPADLSALTRPEPSAGAASGQIANCISILRASRKPGYERLIPPGDPSPFVAGLEREDSVGFASQTNGLTWPQFTWPEWTSPTGERWSFGHVRPVRAGIPKAIRTVHLNWNSQAQLCDLP